MRKKEPEDKQQVTLTDEDGNEVLFNILLTFHSDDFDRSYILLYPANEELGDEIGVQAYALGHDDDPTNPQGGDLMPIDSDAEWDMVESVLNTFTSDNDN